MKVVDLNDKYGPLGEVIFLRVLCYIAESNGYFAQINEALILSIYRSVGSKWIKDRKIVSEVIHYCGVCGLFDVNLLTQNVITSPSIQRRWLNAKIKGRAKGYSTAEYWLLDSDEKADEGDEPLHDLPLQDSNSCNSNDDKCSKNSDNCGNNFDNKERKERKKRERNAAPERLSLPQQTDSSDFQKPTLEEVRVFCHERKSAVNPEKFWNHYEGNGWKTGQVFMRDWRATLRKWELQDKERAKPQLKPQNYDQRNYSDTDLDGVFANED